jgi:hypothetical protein
MSTGYTAGDLKTLLYVEEVTYGITPSTGWKYGTEVTKIVRKDDIGQYVNWWPDNRSPSNQAMVSQKLDAAFTVSGNERVRTDMLSPLIAGAFGSSSGTSELGAIPSYSIIINVAGVRWLYNGCKVDSLTINFADAHSVVDFTAEIIARSCVKMSGNDITGLQTVTVTDPATPKSTSPGAQIGAITLEAETIYPISGSISIKNNLIRERGNIIVSSVIYPCVVTLYEGRRELQAEYDLYLKDVTYLDDMLANVNVSESEVTIGTSVITFNNGHYIVDSSSWPEFVQDQMKQKLRFNFEGAEIG